jgi:8-oxo-dGTP diphosphatase
MAQEDLTMGIGRFLGMVGALIWCPAKEKYLILKRSDEKDYAGGTWECGTGRVDQGESFSAALLREVREELNVDVEIDFILGTAHFYRGTQTPENEMIGVFYRCSLDDPEAIRTSWEHSEKRWVTVQEALALLPEGYWLSRLIQRAEALRSMVPIDLLVYYRENGFEL